MSRTGWCGLISRGKAVRFARAVRVRHGQLRSGDARRVQHDQTRAVRPVLGPGLQVGDHAQAVAIASTRTTPRKSEPKPCERTCSMSTPSPSCTRSTASVAVFQS